MYAEHYKINRHIMSWIGQWPEQAKFNRFFFSFNLIIAVGSQLCLQICSLVIAWPDWDIVIECTTPIIIHMVVLVKFFNCLFNDRKIKSLFVQMRDNWNLATLDAQVRILRTYTDKGKKMIKAYAAIMYGSMSMYIILPVTPSIIAFLTNANQTQMYGVIYHAETIFDVKRYYYFILLHSYYTTFFLITTPVATDSMLIIYVQHACGLLEIIGYELENVKRDDNIDINAYPRHEDDENYRIISNSVAKHTQVLQFAKLLASTYSVSLFLLTLLNIAFITFSGIQVVINMDRPLEALRFTVAGLCLVLHFLFLSMPGQKLIDHSSNVHEYIYAAKWYAISVRARKLLNLMLIRCKIPCQMTAWMCVMSLQNFSTVIQASMSYFTLITSMR